MKNYEFFEHTADIGIRVRGSSLEELFKNAALAMFDIIAEKNVELKTQNSKLWKFTVLLKADNLESLFVDWLNELLSLSSAREKIFYGFAFKQLDQRKLEADISGGDIKDYKINTEIKAATYHELKLQEINSGWQAEVIFDV